MINHSTSRAPKPSSGRKIRIGQSFWVILGYLFWFGFFVGAVILHSLSK